MSDPDVLVSWPRIVLAVEVSVEDGHGEHRQPEISGRGWLAVAGDVFKSRDLDVSEQDVCRQVRGLSVHYRQRCEPPWCDRVDGDGPLDAIACAMAT